MTGFHVKRNTGLKWVKQYLLILARLSRNWASAKIIKLDVQKNIQIICEQNSHQSLHYKLFLQLRCRGTFLYPETNHYSKFRVKCIGMSYESCHEGQNKALLIFRCETNFHWVTLLWKGIGNILLLLQTLTLFLFIACFYLDFIDWYFSCWIWCKKSQEKNYSISARFVNNYFASLPTWN